MATVVALPTGDHRPSVGQLGEKDPLLKKTPLRQLRRRYRNTRKCVGSKAAILVLIWSYIIFLVSSFFYQLNSLINNVSQVSNSMPSYQFYYFALSAFLAIGFCCFPLAGYLADNKFGRYKTTVFSLCILLPSVTLTMISTVVLALTITGEDLSIAGIILIFITSILLLVGYLVMTVSLTGFCANVIQFGLDQLHDSPGEDQSLFIHWFIWLNYAAVFTQSLIRGTSIYISSLLDRVFLLGSVYLVIVLPLIVSLCVACRRRRWFLIDSGRLNPYRQVYQVSKFACQHKVPVNRSAFTYCEDEIPSGLDLGKHKYGGPFTTEQVEDVKAFYGILKVLFSLGPAFYVVYVVNSALPLSKFNASNNTSESNLSNDTALNKLKVMETILVDGNVLSGFILILCVPFYLFLLRPFVSYHVPGMLKRMGIGITVMLLTLISTLTLEMILNARKDLGCMFSDAGKNNGDHYNVSTEPLSATFTEYIAIFKVVHHLISGLSKMVFYIALYEFICSQSPHSMKGLLIGISFTIRGLVQILNQGVVLFLTFYWNVDSLLSCGVVYCLVNVGVSVGAMAVYTCVARRYKYRERDEPCHVRRYVEDYYSKTQPKTLHNYN